MHEEDDHGHGNHGVGWCAKIVFFALSAILAGLVVLIVLENRGGSDCKLETNSPPVFCDLIWCIF